MSITKTKSEIKEVKKEAKKEIKAISSEKSQIEKDNERLRIEKAQLRGMLVDSLKDRGKTNAQLVIAVIALVINVGCWGFYIVNTLGGLK